MDATFTLIGLYVVGQLAFGAWVSRRVRTEDDYLVAGRRLGYPLAVFTIFATWFGAETCIGAAGAVYDEGLAGGTADPFAYGVCLLLMGVFFAAPLWRRRLMTLADLFRNRYSPGVERLAVALMVPTSLLWAAAQVRAFGQVLAVASGLDVRWTIGLAAAAAIAYTAWGGLLADAWTDLVQGLVLIAGLCVLAAAVWIDGGAASLAAVPAERWGLWGGAERSWLAVLEDWAIPLCGSVLAAELVARVIACRTPAMARRASLAAGVVYLGVGLIPVSLGLVGSVTLPGLTHGEQVLPALARDYLPPVLYALFAAALVSAILSTVDSALLVAGSLVSHNVLVPWLGSVSEAGRVRIARTCVVAFGIVAYVMALQAEAVYSLVEEASAFASAGIFLTVLAALYTRWGGQASAAACMLSGGASWILGAYVLELPYPYLVSLAAAGVAYVAFVPFQGRTLPSRTGAASGQDASPRGGAGTMGGRVVEDPGLRHRAPVFRDREHAGQVLARMLRPSAREGGIVLAIPSGGVPVAAVLARERGLPLDVIVVSKITPAWNTETGCGAVAADGTVLVDPSLVRGLGMSADVLEEAVARAQAKVRRRAELLRGRRPFPALAGRQVILVDDGLATGSTMRAAIEVVRKHDAGEIVVAVPTGHADSLAEIAELVFQVVCPNVRSGLTFAVASAYEDWYDVPEEEAADILASFASAAEETP